MTTVTDLYDHDIACIEIQMQLVIQNRQDFFIRIADNAEALEFIS